MSNKISLKVFAVIKLRTLNLILLSFGLVFFACQFSYAEEFFVINKENLSPTEKIVETQTYIDLVWGAYVYRKPAYAFPKDPAATPLPYVPAPNKKSTAKVSSSASLPANSVKPNAATTAKTPTSTSSASGVTQSTNADKVENPVEKITEMKTEVKTEPKIEPKTDINPENPVAAMSATATPITPAPTTPVTPSLSPSQITPTTPATPPVPTTPTISPSPVPTPSVPPVVQTGSPQNPLNAPIEPGNGMINVIDGASRPPYESFVSDLGELRDM